MDIVHRRAIALFVLAGLSLTAAAQETLDSPVGGFVPYAADSGVWDGAVEGVVGYAETIRVPGAAWVRVYFSAAKLDGASTVRITSHADGETQQLNAAGLAEWGDTSAYFNGEAVELELIAAPGTRGNRVAVEHVAVEFPRGVTERGVNGFCGICGTDDRTLSDDDSVARLMPVGCTATVYTSNSCLVSAGHCITGGLVAQFRVPASTPSCITVAPPVEDQFPVTSQQFLNGGVGNDWSVIRTGTNSLGQTAYQRYRKLRRIAPAPAAVGNAMNYYGFGADSNCVRAQVQQFAPGSVLSRTGTTYTYNADVRGGSSGSSMLVDGRIVGIVTHCTTGCVNYGTRIDLAGFVTARTASCPTCLTDLDGNGATDLSDLAILLGGFGACYPAATFRPEADLNADNCTDLVDLATLLGAFGAVCP